MKQRILTAASFFFVLLFPTAALAHEEFPPPAAEPAPITVPVELPDEGGNNALAIVIGISSVVAVAGAGVVLARRKS